MASRPAPIQDAITAIAMVVTVPLVGFVIAITFFL